MSKAQDIYSAAFSKPRDPRSAEYKKGVLDVLRFRFGESQSVRCAYRAGTAQADAYFSGCDEGNWLAGLHLESSADSDHA